MKILYTESQHKVNHQALCLTWKVPSPEAGHLIHLLVVIGAGVGAARQLPLVGAVLEGHVAHLEVAAVARDWHLVGVAYQRQREVPADVVVELGN